MELGSREANRYSTIQADPTAIDRLLVDLSVEAFPTPPAQIVLDLDATDLPLHGLQEQRFFHGYYDGYCYLSLYIFCREHLLCARLRAADQDASAGSLDEVARIAGQVRKAWPAVSNILRGDSGFCRDGLMTWCETNQVDYVFSLARNTRLAALLEPFLAQAHAQQSATGLSSRVFTEFAYQTVSGTWSRACRVIGKAEVLGDKENLRFVVTSLAGLEAQALYEDLYCARGEMENRIKEQLLLFADRVSADTMRANQMRLYLSGLAYVLVSGPRRIGLAGTEIARAQAATIRLWLMKIGGQVRVTARRVWVQLAQSYPWRALFWRVAEQLRR